MMRWPWQKKVIPPQPKPIPDGVICSSLGARCIGKKCVEWLEFNREYIDEQTKKPYWKPDGNCARVWMVLQIVELRQKLMREIPTQDAPIKPKA